ncbi:MAG: HdaA/DnaA family protein [Alphaproteobacteria bacterium]
MTIAQLPLEFSLEAKYLPEDFISSESNRLAVSALGLWPHWPTYGLIMCGAPKVGKTHLAHVFQYQSQALFLQKEHLTQIDHFEPLIHPGRPYILDDVYPWAQKNESTFFHLLNLIKERQAMVLLVAEQTPGLWELQLPDLKSRLAQLNTVRIERPDDELLEAILVKKISEMQVDIAPIVCRYILTHIERSASYLVRFLEEVNRASLVQKRAITVPLVRQVFSGFHRIV